MSKAYLTSSNIDAVIEAATNLRDKLIMWLLSRTGCRVSELLALTVDDVDLASGIIIIKHLKRQIKLHCSGCNAVLSRLSIFCPGCGIKIDETVKEKLEQHHRRVIPIDKISCGMIREYINRGCPINDNGRLILFGINRFRVRQITAECAQKAGIPLLLNPDTGKLHKVGPHSFRVAFTVRWIQEDDSPESLKALQQHLGHANYSTTLAYRKMDFKERRQFYDKIKWDNVNGSSA